MAIHAIGASSGPNGLPRFARNDRIPMAYSVLSFRGNQVMDCDAIHGVYGKADVESALGTTGRPAELW